MASPPPPPPAPRGADVDRTAWFTEARFGLFIHWGLYAIPARGEWVRNRERIDEASYRAYFDGFSPDRFRPAEWAALARRAGQRYAVLTAKHHDGFCLFESRVTGYHALNTPARRDLLREYVDAFREAGLKVGVYYSLLDWQHADYPVDRMHPQRADAELARQPRDFSRYVQYLHEQVRELLSNYGRIDVLWFDFSYDQLSGEAWQAEELVEMARGLQPHIMLNNRLVAGHEDPGRAALMGDFASPEQTIPGRGVVDAAGRPCVWESCMTLNEHWGYARDDHAWKSPATVVRMLVECVSKGGNLLLNVGPDARGAIPPAAQAVLERVAQWMDLHGESIHGCGDAGLGRPDWGRYTRRGRTLYAHVLDRPPGALRLPGMAGAVRSARLLRDGSEVAMARPWNEAGGGGDLFLTLPPGELPDALDTVIALDLAERTGPASSGSGPTPAG